MPVPCAVGLPQPDQVRFFRYPELSAVVTNCVGSVCILLKLPAVVHPRAGDVQTLKRVSDAAGGGEDEAEGRGDDDDGDGEGDDDGAGEGDRGGADVLGWGNAPAEFSHCTYTTSAGPNEA